MSQPTNRYVFRLMQQRGEIPPDAVFVPPPEPEPVESVTRPAVKRTAATPKPERRLTPDELRVRAQDAYVIWHAMLGVEVPEWPAAGDMVRHKFVLLIAGIEDAAQKRRERGER